MLCNSYSPQSFNQSIKSFMFNSVQIQFLNKCSTSNISTTLIINNHNTYLIIYLAYGMKYVLFISLYYPFLMSLSNSISPCPLITIILLFRHYKTICLLLTVTVRWVVGFTLYGSALLPIVFGFDVVISSLQ